MSLDLDELFARARELSSLYAAEHLARSLGLVHVAAAHVTLCNRFDIKHKPRRRTR